MANKTMVQKIWHKKRYNMLALIYRMKLIAFTALFVKFVKIIVKWKQ